MRIPGTDIAASITNHLSIQVQQLIHRHITPQLDIILIGRNPASLSYIARKQKASKAIALVCNLHHLPENSNAGQLQRLVNTLNTDPKVHGIIIQRPVPIEKIDKSWLNNLVIPSKDVDGFHLQSNFEPPIGRAVVTLLKWVYTHKHESISFLKWLRSQKILIIGRGETGGKPIAEAFQKRGVGYTVATSKTQDLPNRINQFDIIISCVGKKGIDSLPGNDPEKGYIVRHNRVNKNSVVIGVGMRSENGKLVADYNQDILISHTAYVSPIPGGVGPINVACLLENVVLAASTSGETSRE